MHLHLIINDAETALQDRLLKLGSEYTAWRIAIFKGSQLELPHRRMLALRESQVAASEVLWPHDITTYFCKDGDIMFLFRNLLKNSLPILQAALLELLPHLKPQDIDFDAFFSFHDLDIARDSMIEMLQMKIVTADRIALKTTYSDKDAPYTWNATRFHDALEERRDRRNRLALVVEDNFLFRQLARNVLIPHYTVAVCADGHEALEFYNANAPDIMFLDIGIPRIDGLAVLQTITEEDPKASVIMFSARSEPHILKQAISLGAKGFVAKPFTAEKLVQYAKRVNGDMQ